jgi:predicted neutral ceramidase superfamily lipid hydrolase
MVKAGVYRISANATLPNGEVDPSPGDNTLTDGFVQVMTPVTPLTARALFIILLIILLVFLFTLLAILVLRRRKTDESEILEQMSLFLLRRQASNQYWADVSRNDGYKKFAQVYKAIELNFAIHYTLRLRNLARLSHIH